MISSPFIIFSELTENKRKWAVQKYRNSSIVFASEMIIQMRGERGVVTIFAENKFIVDDL